MTEETVRKEGHRLNLSVSEVRRRRQGWPARKGHGLCLCAEHLRQRKENPAP